MLSRVLHFPLTLLLIEAIAEAMLTTAIAGVVVLVMALRRHGSVAPMWIAQKTGSQRNDPALGAPDAHAR
jgi:hypothetical protein